MAKISLFAEFAKAYIWQLSPEQTPQFFRASLALSLIDSTCSSPGSRLVVSVYLAFLDGFLKQVEVSSYVLVLKSLSSDMWGIIHQDLIG